LSEDHVDIVNNGSNENESLSESDQSVKISSKDSDDYYNYASSSSSSSIIWQAGGGVRRKSQVDLASADSKSCNSGPFDESVTPGPSNSSMS